MHIDGFGYFTIVSDDESFEDKVPNKTIIAYSAEYLLNNKGINLTFVTTVKDTYIENNKTDNDDGNVDNTKVITSNYFFYREQQPEKSLLHQLVAIAPQWSIGYVSDSLKSKSRSFSQTDKGLYGFLTNEVSQSYEALFVFDNENYTINAYDTTEVIKNTNIVLSFDNLVKNATVSELSDDIYTVINVTGAENLTIAKVNPNGTKKLFCLDYYTGVLDENATNYYENYNEWITNNDLKRKVLEWEKASKEAIYDKSETSYGSWTSLQKRFNLLLLTQQAALNQMQTYYDTAQQNMSLYTEYSEVDKLLVYAKWTPLLIEKQGYVTYGEAKKNGYTIVDYYQVATYTTDDTHTVTRYAYWKNYSQACEANLNILKTSGKLYSARKEDFVLTSSEDNPINADYNVASNATLIANGKGVAKEVKNHEITPSGTETIYSIDALTKEIEAIQKERDKIVARHSFDSYFTDAEKLELDPFLIEGSFSDDTFIVTDGMQTKDYSDESTKVQVVEASGNIVVKTIAELKQDDVIMDDIYVAQQLVDAGYKKLKVVSQPRFSFELESTNFLFIEKFKPFIDQLTSIEKKKGNLFGSILNIQLEDDNWVYPYLQEMEINYDDPDNFSMTFGNRFRISNDVYTFAELHNETTSAVSSVGSLLTAVSQPVTNGTIDSVTRYTKTALIAANQSIKATTDNDFTFGSYGIKGRKKSSEDNNVNGFSPEQLWITNNKICFTDDGWATTKAVFGKITDEEGKDSWGLIADSIVGKLIMGNNLIISNSANNFIVDEGGMVISNDSMEIRLSPDSGIDIIKRTGSGDKDVFQVDGNGNLTINGGIITVGNGTTAGYIIDGNNGTMASIIKDDNGDPIFELTADGHMKVSGLNLGGTEVPKPSDPVPPSGKDGVVDDSGEGLSGGFFEAAWTLLQFFWVGPYIAILNLVGRKDTDGWRGIWNYYSRRTINTMLNDIYKAGYNIVYEDHMTSYVSEQIVKNNKILDNLYVNKTALDDYKTWNDTKKELEAYQLKSDMSDYYTSTQSDSKFVSQASLTQNYYSKSDIHSKFAISENDTLSWQTITIDGKNYTVLTKG